MTEIVLASVGADEPVARRVVEALHGHGLDFWWEQEGGDEPLTTARCVVLIWTRAAALDEGFVVLAKRAARADRAILAVLERAAVPPQMAGVTRVDLTRFKGRKSDLFLLDLLAAARAKAAGIDPPPARGPLRRLLQRLSLLIPTALLALSILANVLGVINIKDLLKFPNADERQAWAALRPGSCADLRVLRDRFPDGYYFDKAMALLTNPSRAVVERWAAQRGPVLFKDFAKGEAAGRVDAEQDALRRVRSLAETHCRQHGALGGDRFLGVDVTPEAPDCTPLSGGFTCGVMADVSCRYEIRISETVEVCGAPKR